MTLTPWDWGLAILVIGSHLVAFGIGRLYELRWWSRRWSRLNEILKAQEIARDADPRAD